MPASAALTCFRGGGLGMLRPHMLSSSAAATVLLVDDEPANLALLFDALAGAGHRVLVAESGESALDLVPNAVPDLILLDVRLPGIDGFTTCERLRAEPRWRDVPVIFLTSLTDAAEKLRAFDCGAVDYVTKPIQAAEVVARVGAQLGLQALRRELAARNVELEAEIVARRETEGMLRHSLEHAVMLIDADGAVRFATRRAEHVLHAMGSEGELRRLPDLWWSRVRDTNSAGDCTFDAGEAMSVRARVMPDAKAGGWCVWLQMPEAEPSPVMLLKLGLTVREAEVLFWISEGKNNPEISILLGISGRTVEKHVENVFNKLGVDHRHAASRMAHDTIASHTQGSR